MYAIHHKFIKIESIKTYPFDIPDLNLDWK